MKLQFSVLEVQFRTEVRTFLLREWPLAARRARPGPRLARWCERFQQACIDAGWHIAWWPTRWGGRGLSSTHAYIWACETGLAGAEFTPGFGPNVVGPALCELAGSEQVQRFLPDIVAGKACWAAAMWEPVDREGPQLNLSVERIADGYRLNGRKCVTAAARPIDWLLCFVRTRSGPLQQATTALIVEATSLSRQKLDDIRTLFTLQQLQVGRAACLGREHHAWPLLERVIVDEQAMFGLASRLHALLADMNHVASNQDHLEQRLLTDLNAAGVAIAALEAMELRLLGSAEPRADFSLQSAVRLRSSSLLRELAGLRLRLDAYAALVDADPAGSDNEALYGSGSGWGMLNFPMAFDDFDLKDRLARGLSGQAVGWVERLAEWGRYEDDPGILSAERSNSKNDSKS